MKIFGICQMFSVPLGSTKRIHVVREIIKKITPSKKLGVILFLNKSVLFDKVFGVFIPDYLNHQTSRKAPLFQAFELPLR